MKPIVLVCKIFLLLSFLVSPVQAEQKQVFDGPDGSEYEVHYNALSSTFLDARIAQQYDLVRSRALGLLNVSIIKVDESGARNPVGAVVEIRSTNDIQQQQNLAVKQVVEQPAIYYLAQVQYREGEILTFDLTVYPEGIVDPLKLRFSHTFYNE